MLALNPWNLHHYWLVFIVMQGAMHATIGESDLLICCELWDLQ